MDFTFCLDLCEFSGLGSSEKLPVSLTDDCKFGLIEFSGMKISLQDVKTNARWNTFNATYLALILIVLLSMEEFSMIV